jgi:demethylmenaquinone methyltransferase/2-methoxy-6-polyprenyl-1,4-benzoquinol methylase
MNYQKVNKEQILTLFNDIARKYDFLNHFLSFGIDKIWRRKAINLIKGRNIEYLLDVASGTGDFALAAMRLNPIHITGIDISDNMLAIGRNKILQLDLQNRISLLTCDSENLFFKNYTFDAVTVAFGVRNFENLEKSLKEIYRVLKEKGIAVILEFSKPNIFPVKQIYNFYFHKILPFIGRLISRNKNAYKYLPESVESFSDRENFIAYLKQAGFANCTYKSLSFGVAIVYIAEKL